jgi:hypothetical protein
VRLHLTIDGIIEVDGIPAARLLPAAQQRLSVINRARDLFDDAADADEEIETLRTELTRLREKRRRALDWCCQSRRTWAVVRAKDATTNFTKL